MSHVPWILAGMALGVAVSLLVIWLAIIAPWNKAGPP